MATVGISREAIAENPDVIFEAMRRLATKANFRDPAPVTIERCPGHPGQVILTANPETCLIHLSQEEWKR
jgi:hypothetical protein